MLDPKYLRNKLNEVIIATKRRGVKIDTEKLQILEKKRKELQIKTQELQNRHNKKSKEIGRLKIQGKNIKPLLKQISNFSNELKIIHKKLNLVQEKLKKIILTIPNIPHKSTPDGISEKDNCEIRRWGKRRVFNFNPQDHVHLGVSNQWIDFETGTKIAGTRFVVLNGTLARLQRALIQFMLDLHINEHGYMETYVPYLVNSKSLYGTGQLPKFEKELFRIDMKPPWYLIPTAEVPLTNILRGKLIRPDYIPKYYVTHTPCFRSEAGSYGKETRGMIRQHQFEKVEMVMVVKPEESFNALEELTKHAETILQRLNLPYRVISICAGDLSFSATKTYDLEVWLPGQDRYYEISSCSNLGSFQARRLQVRWLNPKTKKPELLHTLNGSGLAVGRTLIAVLENYQELDGNVKIPEVLQPYMGGMKTLA